MRTLYGLLALALPVILISPAFAEDIFIVTELGNMFPVEEVHVSNDSELSTLQEDVADLESQMSGIIQIERITGEVIMFGGTEASVPVGWVLCDGQGLSTTTFADLFAVIGYEYGGSGGTFKVPDYQSNNKFPRGASNDAGRGGTGGASTVTLSAAEMPVHTHTQNSHTHTQNSHTHTQNSHTHTQNAHTHTQNSHTHTQNSHTHTQNSHTHTQNAHTHTQNSHTHTQNSHTHTQNAHGHEATVTDPGHQHHMKHGDRTYDNPTQLPSLNGWSWNYDRLTRSATTGITATADPVTATNNNATPTINSATPTNNNATPTNNNATPTINSATPTNNNAAPTNNNAAPTINSATPTNQNTTPTNQNTTPTNQNTGSGNSHENRPPYLDIHFIIKT